jgi:hypothetical protein
MNKKTILLILLSAVSAIAFVYYSKSFITMYVTFDEAKESCNVVQVVADKVPGSVVADTPDGLRMQVKDLNGVEFTVLCADRAALERITQAERVVVVGKYNREQNIFIASMVLTKCPSKYSKLDRP